MKLATASKALRAAKTRSRVALGVALGLTLINKYFLSQSSNRDRYGPGGIAEEDYRNGVIGGPMARGSHRSRVAVLGRVINLVVFACAVFHGIALGDRALTPLTLFRGFGVSKGAPTY